MGYIFDALNRSDANKAESNQEQSFEHHSDSSNQMPEESHGPKLLLNQCQGEDEQHSQGEEVTDGDNNPQVFAPGHQAADFDDRLVAITEPASVIAEEYRSIRTGLLARWDQRRHLIHTITSATPQEGKTITSLNLGLSFAELHNRKTIVIEADMRLPQFGNLFNMEHRKGLLDFLDGQANLDEIITTVGDTPLNIITAGCRSKNNTVQLLSSPRMISLLKNLRQRFDHIIIDTPPVIELADAGIVGSLSDDVLLIVRMLRTPKPLVEQAIRTLDSYNAPVAGVIATDHLRHRRKYYYYRYGYRYHYRYNQAA